MSTTQNIEQEIQAKGADVAPRVTPADVEASISHQYFFTARQGVLGELTSDGVQATAYERANAASAAMSLLTICVLVLKNGFTVTGTSACASPENFDAEIGRKVARQDAVRQVWPLLGYALKERLHSEAKSERRAIEFGDIVHRQVVAMRAAVVAAKLEGLPHGMQWIANTLAGPGHLPDIEEARALGGAQALFDKEIAEHEAFRAAHPAP